ncbi:MAG: hypothetical protein KJ905_02660 [Nanoarchaeota archaeon]|nr:hypothetical protein [Nanoarchaeota archaeon]MBU1501651.1 hypothetical protein [Nanoarchaeota archaeon]
MPNRVCEDLIEEYGDNFVLAKMVAAVNRAVLTGWSDSASYLESVFQGRPRDVVQIERQVLHLFLEKRDIQYLEIYNEFAITAQKHNNGAENFPISETYPEFQHILNEEKITPENLAESRRSILNLLASS